MKPSILFAAVLALAFSLAVGDAAFAAPAKCVGVTKTKAKAKTKACKPAPTALARKKAKSGSATARLAARGKRALAWKLPARKKSAPPEEERVELLLDGLGKPILSAGAFYVINQNTGDVLLEKNARAALPIASITKLMTAMVVLESGADLNETLVVDEGDIDYLKRTHSRLGVGTRLSREEMLQLALMSSENRAASALARYYPGGRAAFVEAMNIKARLIGMGDSRFYDSTGLDPRNISSPRDLARMVMAAARYPLIREFSTTTERHVFIKGKLMRFGNTNGLIKSPDWSISVSKTGYISEAGRCLVMQAWMRGQPMVIVLMDSNGRYMRTVDAQRVRLWLEEHPERVVAIPEQQQG
ncbi:MAG: serine hydrolase [Azoarcus sp.]|jgi:D-alanyl-D-alanine endopeptidase (penicillin-binding protein 7)|nr:serine hydrolase [Azoarcus sp.]